MSWNSTHRWRLVMSCVLAVVLTSAASGCATGQENSLPVPAQLAEPVVAQVVNLQLEASAFAPEKVKVAIYLPPGYDPAAARRYPVLYLNDGQDAAAVGLQEALARLYAQDRIEKLVVVAIDMLPDRMGTYGLSNRAAGHSLPGGSRFGTVGARAHDYSQWVALQLVPYVDAHYRTRAQPQDRTMLGWSLGALNAFNLGWEYPEVFGQIGAFSPSFWLAADRTDADSIQRTRLAQGMVQAGPRRDGLRMWLAVGTDEETDDRDADGISDAVDDTRDFAHALAGLGYAVDYAYTPHANGDAQVAFYLLQGGHHDQAAWAQMLPLFLQWAFAANGGESPPDPKRD